MKSKKENNFQSQGGNPTGFLGFVIGKLMNIFHSNSYKLGLSKISIDKNSICLDIGCGGGKVVKLLAQQKNTYKVYGLDHSKQMVKLSQKLNKLFIKNGKADILQGSVSTIPFSDSHFDLITAFETIQFWPDINQSFTQIKKKLKSSGIFLIVNRLPQEGTKWFDFTQVKNANDYNKKLQDTGFKDISIDTKLKPGWIFIVAK